MNNRGWTLYLAVALIVLSVFLYALHFVIFQDLYHIEIYLLGDLAFLPIEVLLVTIILHGLLENRDRETKLQKLNMVIGVFFSVVGTRLLTVFSDHDPGMASLKKELQISESWQAQDFARVDTELSLHSCGVVISDIDLSGLRAFLSSNEDFLIRLLENPLLLEHESFTGLLQAVFHLTDELEHRKDLTLLPENDLKHISGDICRAYQLLLSQWLMYMHYLKDNYPYLFSLAVRTNPFDEKASAMIS
jgi:hypothetical protein